MADTQISVSITVSPLEDNAVWFANSAAWTAYWEGQGFLCNIPIAAAGQYGVVQSAITVAYAVPIPIAQQYVVTQIDLDGSGNLSPVYIPTKVVQDALVTQLNTLIADYAATKLALKNAGIISTN